MAKKHGIVKWFDKKKGFGFIEPQDKGPDVFVHITALHSAGLNDLQQRQKVMFNLAKERNRTAAVDLELVE